ncbi:Protease [Alteripontixanthobacter maritimus]|uniref:Protease n=1 Tax=Alteripontixanthobacter maritimus TaxID=2161824 RepID=A0A369Q2V0_9SPHN|nr:signal peptide peptidase SppA [Alteripontixanthobacter maritimus]RDC59221.1 Protease [Alteripontixanthobacter maritimus]
MAFARKIWHLMVAVKDGLSLLFLLLFFLLLYAVLTARPSPAQVREGALYLDLAGSIVEEKSEIDPLSALLASEAPVREFQARDLVRAIDAAAGDDRIKAVVLDLDGFMGGGQVHLQAIGAAMDRVRKAEKPVLAYAMAYGDSAIMLSSHASEVWLDPLGGAAVVGPGGGRLYYGELLDNLKVNARVYRVGTYKSAVEPFERNSMSDAARENYRSLYGALWEEWQANVKKARPKIALDRITSDPAQWVLAADGNLAAAALEGGLVDKLGTRTEFGERVAKLAGEDPIDDTPGAYAYTDYSAWLSDNPIETTGSAIGVVTIAGTIEDGDAGPGTAGGARIARILDEALDDDLAALVVRVDSPGGSVTASEQIRLAILRHKQAGTPIAISMGNVAASGGYWVATPGDRIFAEPETITGSIGVFAVLPTFERAAEYWGVTSDGVKTTPLSGEPDFVGGFAPEVETILQSGVEHQYGEFIKLVAKARKLTPEAVDRIGQGRVWDGGAARQIGLVDQYGDLPQALEWAAQKADLGDDWHVTYLGEEASSADALIRQLLIGDDVEARAPMAKVRGGDMFAMIGRSERMRLGRIAGDLELLLGAKGAQAYCLACPPQATSPTANMTAAARELGWMRKLALVFAGR